MVTTGSLFPHERLTVSASFPKGVLQQPSQLQVAVHWAGDNLAVFPSLLGVVWIAFYVGWLFLYGAARPPAVIVPQFAPPSGFSPAMVGYLENKGLSHRDFSAGIVGLAVARHLKLIHREGTYRLVRQEGGQPVTDLEARFESALFRTDDELSLSATNRNRVVIARAALENFVRGAVMPALLYKEPRNVRPARTIKGGPGARPRGYCRDRPAVAVAGVSRRLPERPLAVPRRPVPRRHGGPRQGELLLPADGADDRRLEAPQRDRGSQVLPWRRGGRSAARVEPGAL